MEKVPRKVIAATRAKSHRVKMVHRLRVRMVHHRHVKMTIQMTNLRRVMMVTDLRAVIATPMIDQVRVKIHPPHPRRARPTHFHFQVQALARTVRLMQSSPAMVMACRHHSSGAIYQRELKVWR
jgi:hypothetical protein